MAENPFEVTKAVDFTDEQIAATWVDLPGGGFSSLADPRSPMPMFLVGGKGGGRTHLLRHCSYALQRLRHTSDESQSIFTDGYVGIYFRCGGLNSSRFSGKGQDADTWATVFAYYTEVWLGRVAVELLAEVLQNEAVAASTAEVAKFCSSVRALFDVELPDGEGGSGDTLSALLLSMREVQRSLDIAINNAGISGTLDVEIGASPGRIVFGIPTAASSTIGSLSGIAFAYLIDEFENLTEEQQRYVNTLIREKELPTNFLIGSRLFGLRTHLTLSAGEENRLGSEFDMVKLEDAYRNQSHGYRAFCTDIVRSRLRESGVEIGEKGRLSDFFARPADDAPDVESRSIFHCREHGISEPSDAPWIVKLRGQLSSSGYGHQAEEVSRRLALGSSPLHSKFGTFLLYREWAGGSDPLESARQIEVKLSSLAAGEGVDEKLVTTYKHYRHDLYAQLVDDLRLQQEYSGFNDFVMMSGYLPRNLLVVLKQVTRWSLFRGERPFTGGRVSVVAQTEGVREASSWFLGDSRGLGRIGDDTESAVRRLGSFFRQMRFADKPVEVSCITFSTDRSGLTEEAARCLDQAVSHSLILEIARGRKDKNSRVLHRKYQLNPMLAPLFDLPLALRGSTKLSAVEMNSIFDPSQAEGRFDSVQRLRLNRMNAPFGSNQSQPTFEFE
jgi:hypothetical protein